MLFSPMARWRLRPREIRVILFFRTFWAEEHAVLKGGTRIALPAKLMFSGERSRQGSFTLNPNVTINSASVFDTEKIPPC